MSGLARQARSGKGSLVLIMAIALGLAIGLLLFDPNGVVRTSIRQYRERQEMKHRVRAAWADAAATATRLEGDTASLGFFEVIDYECPFCRKSYPPVAAYEAAPHSIGIGYLHRPIEPAHPHARLGALIAICAEEQHRFQQAHELLFTTTGWMDSLQVPEIAAQIGGLVVDSFAGCLESARAANRLRADSIIVDRFGFMGTPAFVNGEEVRPGIIDSTVLAQFAARSSRFLP